MPSRAGWRLLAAILLAGLTALATPGLGAGRCDDEQATRQVPTDLALCRELEPIVRRPNALPADQYQVQLNRFLGAMCHRNTDAGWKMDKSIRDTGPFTAVLADGKWSGSFAGTHSPVLVWYSPDMIDWLHANRPADHAAVPATPAPIPEGAIMVKELYSPAPASSCRIDDLLRLRPVTKGFAVMVRDSVASRDGWFWGVLGWRGWVPDWPPPRTNAASLNGFGPSCTTCHASAQDNHTFASLNNIQGEPGTFLSFLSQDFFLKHSDDPYTLTPQVTVHDLPRLEAVHEAAAVLPPARAGAFMQALHLPAMLPRTPPAELVMPSESFDHTWIPGAGPSAASTFVTSDQCGSCHDAGTTQIQFDMTVPAPTGQKLINLSPYGTWRSSPMGMAGRDPLFFAQLASETQTFHPQSSAMVQDTCLGCHGVQGQRQAAIDPARPADCPSFLRQTVDAVPFPSDNPTAGLASFGALARDGVSCTTCHRMVLGQADTAKFQDAPQNRCVAQRQDALNHANTGFARSFTGSFLVGPPEEIYGPFKDPKTVPMQHALGITPVGRDSIGSSELCGTCHTVHLPVLQDGRTLGHTYEQTTYPEWAFSAYRTGDTPDGALPQGAGALAQSCQDCHLPKTDSQGQPFRSKIASILEHTGFPEVEHGLPAADIDLPVRSGFARHLLVGLNVFLVEMGAQFGQVLGLAEENPALGSRGVPGLDVTRDAMLDQAAHRTAAISVTGPPRISGSALAATVVVANKSGHKLPSGVGFRRAFVDFRVLDAAGRTLWESGRTNAAGVLVDQHGQPIAGEMWWQPDCSARLTPAAYQPHYQAISRQDQVQVYQELVTAPPPGATAAQCGIGAAPSGPLTTSFLSICAKAKDNRLLPDGFLPLAQRIEISRALGAGDDLAQDTSPVGVGEDPDYRNGGGDTLQFRIPLAEIPGQPARVEATLYYQATPPFYLQDRFCTAAGTDRDRLAYIAGGLKLGGTAAADWKLRLVSSGQVPVRR